MTNDEALQAVQEVLRGMLMSIVLNQKMDPLPVAGTLRHFAHEVPNLMPQARLMLADLAEGLEGLVPGRGPKQ